MVFKKAFCNAKAFDKSITENTHIYAVFISGLNKVRLFPSVVHKQTLITPIKIPVKVTIVNDGNDYKVDKVPAKIVGQSYIVLSRSETNFSDESIIAGPVIVEVYPKGKGPY